MDLFHRFPVAFYYLFTLAFSTAFILLGYVVFPGRLLLVWIGMWGPAVSGLAMTAILGGKPGLERLLKRLFIWRVPVWVIVIMLLLPVVWMSGAYGLHALFGGGQAGPLVSLGYWLSDLVSHLPLLLGLGLGMAVLAAGEEIGWRGFAQPTLENSLRPLPASLLVGLMWGMWHIPATIDPGYVLNRAPLALSIPLFTLSTMLFSVIYTALMYHGKGSLLLVCLFHGWYNTLNFYAMSFFPFFVQQYWWYTAAVGLTILAFLPFAPFRRSTGPSFPTLRQPHAPAP